MIDPGTTKTEAVTATDAPPPSRGSPGRQAWLIAALLIIGLLSTLDRQLVALLVAPIRADLGLSDTQISVLIGLAFALIYTLTTVPAGYLADTISRRSVIGVGVAIWSVMTAVCGLATTYPLMFLARLGVGAGEGAIQPAAFALTRDGVDPRWRGRAFGFLQMATLAGVGFSALVGGALIDALQKAGPLSVPFVGPVKLWQAAFMIVGLAGLPFALLIWSVREPPREAAPPGQNAASFGQALGFMGRNWKIYLPLSLFLILNGMHASTYGAWAPSLVSRMWGYSPARVGATYGPLMMIGAPIGLIVTGLIIDRLARGKNPTVSALWVAMIGGAAVAVNASLIPLSPNQPAFWSMFVIQALVTGAPITAAHVFLANITPGHWIGKVAAIKLLIQGVFGLALGPSLAAVAGDVFFPGKHSLQYGISAFEIVDGVGMFVVIAILLRVAGNPMRA